MSKKVKMRPINVWGKKKRIKQTPRKNKNKLIKRGNFKTVYTYRFNCLKYNKKESGRHKTGTWRDEIQNT